MPFVLMCGFPSSGKTTRAKELRSFLVNKQLDSVVVAGDDDYDVNKNDIYADSFKEKERRGNLKSMSQRNISKDSVLILDSLNYIKGYRYELYCATKSAQTPQCVIHCAVTPAVASEWNQQRPEAERYSQQILDALVMRFEPPDSRNRWDSPLFIVHPDDDLPCDQIYDALFHKKAPPPNHSTLSQPLSSANFLHELDRITQSINGVIMEAQKTSVPGDHITIPDSNNKLELTRTLTLAELQRTRRQFISFTKTHPVEDTSKIASMFVQFLNNTLQ